MYREILVQVTKEETKVAVMEEGHLVEIYVERELNHRLNGNIYRGVVKNVLPGMQAAFVDIGLEKNAFLYVEDALSGSEWDEKGNSFREGLRPNIRDIVKEGQELLVQIAKEPLGSKGARITTQITLPGRFLVLMPSVDYIGISRRISDEAERERLKNIAELLKPGKMGIIVRTVAEGAEQEELRQDIESLLKLWKHIKMRGQAGHGPALIHRDLDLVQRILRDIFSDDVQRLLVNSRDVFDKVIEYLDVIDPNLKHKVFISDTANLFAKHAVEHEIYQALKRKVWLKSGGYLVIDQMEALTAVDVNTGKFVGSTDLADTVLKTNVEAAKEIARQLRLRNIGGIIIIDFIDMQNPEHKEEVLQLLTDELKKDKVKAHVLGITPLGLVELTRKKVGQSLSVSLEKSCPCCEGKGTVLSEETVCLSLKNELRERKELVTAEALLVEAHPLVAGLLIGSGGSDLKDLEKETGLDIVVRGRGDFHLTDYEIKPVRSLQDTERAVIPVEEGQVIKAILEYTHTNKPGDGIIRLDGYVIQVEKGGEWLGRPVYLEILQVFRTYARAQVLGEA